MNTDRLSYGRTSGLPTRYGEVFYVDLRASSQGILHNVAGQRYYLQDGSQPQRPPVMRVRIFSDISGAAFIRTGACGLIHFNASDIHGNRVMQEINGLCLTSQLGGTSGAQVPILQGIRLDPRKCYITTVARLDAIVPVYFEYADL